MALSPTAGATGTTDPDRNLAERVSYLASLASDKAAIDPLLDTLRDITSRWQSPAPMSQPDRQLLLGLETKLKTYLTTDDPLRTFTPESLEARLQGKEGRRKRDVPKLGLITIPLFSGLAAGLALLLSPPSLALKSRLLLTVPFFFLVLHIGIAWFYLSSIRGFKPEFRRAFIYICIGVLLFSVSYSHYVIMVLFNLDRFPAFQYGGLTGLITLSFISIYMGLRLYASLLSIKTRFMSLPIVALVMAIVAVAAIVAPHGGSPHELFFDISLVWLWWLILFLVLCLGVSRSIIQMVTPSYARPMRWLYRYFIIGLLGALGSSTVLPVLGELRGDTLNTLSAVLGIGPQSILLYAGYLFKKETSR